MLIQFGNNRSAKLDQRLACSLAFIAGALNSAGFFSLGFFAANMTGNVSTGADKIALGDVLNGAVYLLLPVSFIFGATLATLWVDTGLRRGVVKIYALSIVFEASMLIVLGVVDVVFRTRGTSLVLGLSVLMGFQNAIATRISSGRVRTTHVSGMSTDIGIGIGLLASMMLRRETPPERPGAYQAPPSSWFYGAFVLRRRNPWCRCVQSHWCCLAVRCGRFAFRTRFTKSYGS